MKNLLAALMLFGTPAWASCPDPELAGEGFVATGPSLIAPQSWEVVAGGDVAAPCADWAEQEIAGDIEGYVSVAPTAVFELSEMGPHILMVMARAECGAVLMARTGDGLWFFGETAADREEITIWGAPNAQMQVWVGSKSADGCPAEVTLETFDR